MSDTTFFDKVTTVVSSWLNDVNRLVYDIKTSTGSGLVGHIASAAGAVARTLQSKDRDTVSLFDFMTAAQIADFSAGTALLDITAAVQAFVTACSSNTGYGAPEGIIPAGRGKITATVTFPYIYCKIRGAGLGQSQFLCDGVAGSVFKAAALTYFRPTLTDFSIVGNAASGIGLDLSAVTSDVYDGSFERLYIQVGGHGIYCEKIFSFKLDNVYINSTNGHAFLLLCGPAVTFISCYAIQCGTNKAGYRLGGYINMIGCNGGDTIDYWGVFGQDPASADGFQADFTSVTNDYPDIVLQAPNIENFSKCGISVQNAYKQFDWRGGKIDRNSLSTAYIALIRVLQAPLFNAPIRLSLGNVSKGAGTPNGGAALTTAWLYSKAGNAAFIDLTGAFVSNGITSYYANLYPGSTPLVTQGFANDVFQDAAQTFNAIAPRRISANVIRYASPAALTPVGAGQAIDVTGYTKLTVTPAAASSITTATFTQTVGGGVDYLRNGDLLIEAGNANLTVNHTALGGAVNTFVMSAGAGLALGLGRVIRFCWSSTNQQWIQV